MKNWTLAGKSKLEKFRIKISEENTKKFENSVVLKKFSKF